MDRENSVKEWLELGLKLCKSDSKELQIWGSLLVCTIAVMTSGDNESCLKLVNSVANICQQCINGIAQPPLTQTIQ